MDKIEKLKKFLQENYPNMQAFNARNITGDFIENVYDEDNIQVYYAPGYEYIEIFGLSDDEFESLLEGGCLKTFSEYKKLDIQVGDKVTIDCVGDIKTIIITSEQQIKQIKENVAIFTNKILKIERPNYEVVEEKKELLTEEEKEFLKDIIENVNKYSCMEVNTISFRETNNGKLVINCFNNDYCMCEMVIYEKFENLNKSERYTLKELGLEGK